MIVAFTLKKCYCSRGQETITLTNFDGNPQQRIIEDNEKSLTDEEKEFDELVDEFNRVRQAAAAQNDTNGTILNS